MRPCRPCGPAGPTSPDGPAGPVGPSAPVKPRSPWEPCGPAAPVGPAGPVSPCGPAAPVGPAGRSRPAARRHPAAPADPPRPLDPARPGGRPVRSRPSGPKGQSPLGSRGTRAPDGAALALQPTVLVRPRPSGLPLDLASVADVAERSWPRRSRVRVGAGDARGGGEQPAAVRRARSSNRRPPPRSVWACRACPVRAARARHEAKRPHAAVGGACEGSRRGAARTRRGSTSRPASECHLAQLTGFSGRQSRGEEGDAGDRGNHERSEESEVDSGNWRPGSAAVARKRARILRGEETELGEPPDSPSRRHPGLATGRCRVQHLCRHAWTNALAPDEARCELQGFSSRYERASASDGGVAGSQSTARTSSAWPRSR